MNSRVSDQCLYTMLAAKDYNSSRLREHWVSFYENNTHSIANLLLLDTNNEVLWWVCYIILNMHLLRKKICLMHESDWIFNTMIVSAYQILIVPAILYYILSKVMTTQEQQKNKTLLIHKLSRKGRRKDDERTEWKKRRHPNLYQSE